MSEALIPPAPQAPPPSAPVAPKHGPTGIRKSHLGLILGGAVVLFLLVHMCSSSSSTGGAAATGSSASSSDNPLIGSWSLEATEDKSFCATHEKFMKDSMEEVKSGTTSTYSTIYLIKPNYVDVAENGNIQNYGEWDETAPDEITFRINSLYVAASCKYHRD